MSPSVADILFEQLEYLIAYAEHPLSSDMDRARLDRVRLILMSIFDEPATTFNA